MHLLEPFSLAARPSGPRAAWTTEGGNFGVLGFVPPVLLARVVCSYARTRQGIHLATRFESRSATQPYATNAVYVFAKFNVD